MDESFTSFYSLYGLIIKVQCKGKWIKDEVEHLLDPFPFTKINSIADNTHINLQFVGTEIQQKIPDTLSVPLTCYGISIFRKTVDVYISDGYSLFQLNPEDGIGTLIIHNSSFKEKSLLSKYNIFLVGLIHLISHFGLYDLHAAALIKNNTGYLFLGDPNTGKSSAAFSLVNQGWQFISDDAVLLRSQAKFVEVFAFRKKFYLDKHLANKYPKISRYFEEPTNKEDTKRFLDMELLYPRQFCKNCIPKLLVFTRIVNKSTSKLIPLDQSTAFVKLLKQSVSIFFNHQYVNAHTVTLKRLINQTTSYELWAGRDLYNEPDKISKILTSKILNIFG